MVKTALSSGMDSSIPHSYVVHADELNQSTSLPSTSSSCYMPLITSVSTLSACENDNRNLVAEADTLECDVPKLSVACREGTLENSVKLDTLNSLKEGDDPTLNRYLIRPLSKYIKNNKCLLCGFELKAKDNVSIRSHLLVHMTNKGFKCNICGKKFSKEYNMFMHSFVHRRMFNSGVGSAEVERPEITLRKNTINTLPVFKKRHTNNTKVIRPLYKYIKNNKCLLCGFQSKAKDIFAIRNHLHVHITNKEFKCDTCDRKFRSEQHLTKHRLVHQDVFPFSCDLCDKKYRSSHSLRNHKIKKHRTKQKFKCEVCGKVLATSSNLEEHSRIHTGELPFACDVCGKTFRLKRQLSYHLRRHYADDKADGFRQGNLSSRKFACSSGMTSSESKTGLDHAELLSPSASLPSSDSTCTISLTDSVSMPSARENNRDVGGGASTQTCDVQQFAADSAEDGKPENAIRSEALETFRYRRTMNTKLIHPLYKYIKDNKCLLCGFESNAKDISSIRYHLYVHVTSKDFKCDTCNKKFQTEKHLIKHSIIHSDVFPFSCDLCDKKFRSKSFLALHNREKHVEKRKCKCEFCGKVLSSNVVLKEHLRIHTGERPFVCDLCNQSFRLKCYLSNHLRRHHAGGEIHGSRQSSSSSDPSCL